jgi:tryptophan synthase alpha chain
MNRINQLFQTKPNGILSVFFTAGYPTLHSTVEIIKALAHAGADMIEIGIPFSDPMADGPVIQKSSDAALRQGMNLKLLFGQLRHIRSEVDIPLLLMGYLNPVMQYGLEKFCLDCSETGIDGVILPDLPLEVYLEDTSWLNPAQNAGTLHDLFSRYNLHNIFLVFPQTGEDRIRKIDSMSRGFIYLVSSSSTTGAKEGFSQDQLTYFQRIRKMKLNNPGLIGFGISNHDTFYAACQQAQGAIIGSAFVKMLGSAGDLKKGIQMFVKDIRGS